MRVEALRLERSEMLQFCRDLTDQEWRAASCAPGWRVQDVSSTPTLSSFPGAVSGRQARRSPSMNVGVDDWSRAPAG